ISRRPPPRPGRRTAPLGIDPGGAVRGARAGGSALVGGVVRAGLLALAVLGRLLGEDLLLLGDRDDVVVRVGRDGVVGAGDEQAVRLLVGPLTDLVEADPLVVDAVGV